MNFPKILFISLIAALACGCALTSEHVDLLIENATVYDGYGGEGFTADVSVRDGKFLYIDQSGAKDLTATERIDGTDKFVVPGLWDMHVHVASSEEGGVNLTSFIEHGVTSVRDLGGYGGKIRQAQTDVENGALGPKIYSSYEMLNGESFIGFQLAVTNEQETSEAIEAHVAAGAALIKIHRAIAPNLLPSVINESHVRGLKLTGHIPLGVSAGMDGVEHVGSFPEAYISAVSDATSDVAIEYMLSSDSDVLFDCLASQGVAVAPTLVIYPSIAKRRSEGGDIPQAFLDFIKNMKKITLRLHERGVLLLTGTDTSDLSAFTMPAGASLLDELELLQDAGIAAQEIIPMATSNAAQNLGVLDKIGSIEPGKTADFLLLSEDPGADIKNMRALISVYQNGIKQ